MGRRKESRSGHLERYLLESWTPVPNREALESSPG